MRVLEILGSLHRGGAETMIMNYYRAFDKKQCQMDFIIHAQFDNDYCEEAASMGAKIIMLDRPGQVGAAKYIMEMCLVIKNNGPYDAVHIHTNYQAFLSIIAARMAGIKRIIVHSHTTKFSHKQILINRAVMKLFKVTRVACGTAAGQAFFGKNYVIVNNAIDASRFKRANEKDVLIKKQNEFGNKYVIGHLGSFTTPKNHEFIIEIAKELLKYQSNFVIALYGNGELEGVIKDKVEKEGLQNVILFKGVTVDAPSTYRMFDVFILPSLYEGFPVTLVESQLSDVMSLASTSVSKECDLHIGKLEYIELNAKTWAIRINEIFKNEKRNSDNECNVDDYDVNIQWHKLYLLYKGEKI